MANEPISFTARDFLTIKQEMTAFVRETAPDLWSDFFESDLGVLLIDLAAMVGDVLSMSSDSTAAELFLATARRYESGLRFARSVGYTPRSAAAATVTVKSLSLPDSLVTNGGFFSKGAFIRGQNGLVYELQANFAVNPGDTVARLVLREGTTYTEQFESTNQQNQEVQVTNFVVQDASWQVFVGDPTLESNLWTQVPSVQFETGPTQTYDAFYDGLGRVHFHFGDGVSGKIPDGEITVVYRTCSGASGNAPVGSISGSMTATLNSGLGTVSVAFQNIDLDTTASVGTRLNDNEAEGLTVASASQSGNLLNTPVSAGSVILTINVIGGGGTLVLQDQADGSFQIVQNSIPGPPITLISSNLVYNTGAWAFTLSTSLAAGSPITATYFSIVSSAQTATVFIGAATGGADRESLDDLRRNVPAYIRSQNRIITLQDYSDVLRQLNGVALVFPDRYISSYTANAVKLNIWSSEVVTFQTESSDGTVSQVPYTRYVELQQDQIGNVQNFLTPRTLFNVHNIILRPGMLWVDIYLGQVTYDTRQTKQIINDAIAKAVVAVFQASSGFAIRLSDVYDAIRSVAGVKWFQILRIATGTQATSTETTGQTTNSATVSGTLLTPIVTPGTVTITIEQSNNAPIVISDNATGGFLIVSGGATLTILSSSIDYRTGAFTVTFSAAIGGNQDIIASYANVTHDYRAYQVVAINGSVNSDAWPPPGIPTTNPITTPPYKDGLPLSATRPSALPIQVSGVTRVFGSGTVTATVNTVAAHGLSVGSIVTVIGASPSVYSGTFVVTAVPTTTSFKYAFSSISDPGVITGTIVVVLITPAPPYQSGDVVQYDKLQDIVIVSAAENAHFYDETFLYNDEIYYDSVESLTSDVRAINLRRLVFDLVPG